MLPWVELRGYLRKEKMKKIYFMGFILVILLSACTSSVNNSTSTMDLQYPTVDVQRAMEMTRESSAMETVIALEQSTNAPTVEVLSNLPKPWMDITTLMPTLTPPPNATFASGAKPRTPIFLGPGYGYRMACYVDQETQLIIAGRSIDSSWLRVLLGQGHTCFTFDENSKRTELVPDPSLQFWVFRSTITFSGDLSNITIITPIGTPSPYGAAFLWNDKFNNSEQNRALLFERKGFPISSIFTGVGLTFWLGMILRSFFALPRRQRSTAH
jgi:hypothetical protein